MKKPRMQCTREFKMEAVRLLQTSAKCARQREKRRGPRHRLTPALDTRGSATGLRPVQAVLIGSIAAEWGAVPGRLATTIAPRSDRPPAMMPGIVGRDGRPPSVRPASAGRICGIKPAGQIPPPRKVTSFCLSFSYPSSSRLFSSFSPSPYPLFSSFPFPSFRPFPLFSPLPPALLLALLLFLLLPPRFPPVWGFGLLVAGRCHGGRSATMLLANAPSIP